jgi:hypothetical protein
VFDDNDTRIILNRANRVRIEICRQTPDTWDIVGVFRGKQHEPQICQGEISISEAPTGEGIIYQRRNGQSFTVPAEELQQIRALQPRYESQEARRLEELELHRGDETESDYV